MKNITYINAGAGSGKTYRLTEEMANLVKDGHCTPSQIIASTFTTAAAADLKKNARKKFLDRKMFTEAAELDSAAIGTVHSIGLQYIKKYWYKLGLSASVETITDEAKMSYLNRTMTKVVNDDDIAAFREFVETYNIKPLMSSKYDYDFWKPLVQGIVEKADAFGINDLNDSETKSLELAELLLGADGRFSFLNGKTRKSENELRSMYYDCIRRIFRIARDWNVLFNQFKGDHGLIEFNDMENKFIRLLEDEDVQDEISRSIKYVFVDEFQDSNPKQIRIFDLLSDLVERSYWVGDPKQAIYGFRGCDTELVQALTEKIINEKGNNGMDYDTLKESRRSVQPLVDTASAVFTKVFDNLDPEMVKLKAHRTELLPDNTPALWHWEQQKTLEAGKKQVSVSKEKLFNSIARQVRDIMDKKSDIKLVFDKESGQTREVRYSDIAVLTRKNDDVKKITNTLKAKDIPVVCEEIAGSNNKEFRLVYLLLNYMIDESPLLKAEIAHLLFGMKTEDVLKNKELPDFSKLNTLKERMKTLSVSDIVKSIILELDLVNRCHKWGKAEQRERTLQALIEDAQAFDVEAETLGEASSIEHYLDHLDKEGITVNKGFFQEGVHVINYHQSKGLQWNIVILCSLEDDSMVNENTLMKHFAIYVNYVRENVPDARQLYSNYHLTCLPRFFASEKTNFSDTMKDDIKTLESYRRFVQREQREAKRLLYVGVTRARDYLITTSQVGKEMNWLTASGIQPEINDSGDYQAIWGKERDVAESKFVKVADDGTYQSRPEPDKYSCRKEKTIATETEEKYLSPSKMVDDVLKDQAHPWVIYPVQDEKPHPINVVKSDEEYDIMGTCIHNIFAIYHPEADRAEMRNKAQKIVDAYKMNKMLPDVDSILDSINGLYQFLEKAYGKAYKVEHEVPFRNEDGGQVIVGEMDLLWYTSPTECVLIDFKNYPGDMSKALNKTAKEYVGQYAAQLNAYEEALIEAGKTVKEKLVYYSVLGYLVQLEEP